MQSRTTQDRDEVVPVPNDRQLEYATRVAVALFARAKAEHCSEDPALARPLSSVFLTDTGQVFLLQGSPFYDHREPEEDQHALAVKLIARCAGAWAAVDIRVDWGLDQCATCGEIFELYPAPCLRCGASPVPPDENPFRRKVLCTVLHVRESPLNRAWLAEEQRGGDGRIIGWTDFKTGEPCPADPVGRFEVPWAVDSSINAFIVVNQRVMGQFLGHAPYAELVATARLVEVYAPRCFRFPRLDPERMMSVIRRVTLEALIS